MTVRCGGERVPLSVKTRQVLPGRDLLLMVHGFGCAGQSFDTAFDSAALARTGLPLATFDLPGHGRSGPLPAGTDAIETYAEATLDLVRQLAPSRLYLLCHSMGTPVGLVATQDLGHVDGFISVEGNLVAEDCGLVSRRAAAASPQVYAGQEYPRFHAELAGSPRRDQQAWARWFAQADPAALHQAASSLVAWSDSGKLLGWLRDLPASAYVYGSGSGDLSHVLSSLGPVPAYPIAGSGHFPMIDNPAGFWFVVAAVLASGR